MGYRGHVDQSMSLLGEVKTFPFYLHCVSNYLLKKIRQKIDSPALQRLLDTVEVVLSAFVAACNVNGTFWQARNSPCITGTSKALAF